ncbi:MAG: hypothetical protein DRI73_01470 [Bacteroidetes bacterium]|nr:MAG: hypothetical protein DRI73_01470 [Bacteroidota bacterium]
MRVKLNIFLLLVLIFVIYACKKDTKSVIPETYVDFTIRLTDPLFNDLNAIGNSVIVTSNYNGFNSAGYNNHGIIVYRASQTEFYAFDRTCTFEEKLDQTVKLESPVDLSVECPECGSEFVLPSYGAPTVDGPAIHPLKQYYTSFDGNLLWVYNHP